MWLQKEFWRKCSIAAPALETIVVKSLQLMPQTEASNLVSKIITGRHRGALDHDDPHRVTLQEALDALDSCLQGVLATTEVRAQLSRRSFQTINFGLCCHFKQFYNFCTYIHVGLRVITCARAFLRVTYLCLVADTQKEFRSRCSLGVASFVSLVSKTWRCMTESEASALLLHITRARWTLPSSDGTSSEQDRK